MESWCFGENKLLKSLRFPRNLMVLVKIQISTPAPDQGGPAACLGGLSIVFVALIKLEQLKTTNGKLAERVGDRLTCDT